MPVPFNPAAHPLIRYYVPPISDVPAAYYKSVNKTGGQASLAGDTVGSIDMGVGGLIFNSALGPPDYRPVLASDGLGRFAVQGATGKGFGYNTASYGAPLHQNDRLFIIAFLKPSIALNAQWGTTLFDNTNNANDSATNTPGVSFGLQAVTAGGTIGGVFQAANGSVWRLRIKNDANNATSPHLKLITEEPLNEAVSTPHLVWAGHLGDGLFGAQVDRGRISRERVSGNPSAANPPFGMFFLNRASLDAQYLPAMVHAAAIYSDYPGADEVQSWVDKFGVGNIAGSPEIRVGDMIGSISKSGSYASYCLWFANRRISPQSPTGGAEDGEGCVFNDGVTGGGWGVDGWRGSGAHGYETLIGTPTVSVDGSPPAPVVNGSIYQGEKVVKIRRQSTIGVSFTHDEQITWETNSRRTWVKLTRLADGRNINPLYIIRSARTRENEGTLCFDIDGNILLDTTIATTTNSLIDMPYNPTRTIAVAQWAPGASTMSLTVMLKGYELNHRFVIVDDTYNRRIYQRVFDVSTVPGSTIEMEILSKHFLTTAGEWKALAQAELLKALNPTPSPLLLALQQEVL